MQAAPPQPQQGSTGRPPHHRAPRDWPPLCTDAIELPYPTPPARPPATTLLVTAAGLVGAILSALFLVNGGGSGSSASLGIGFLAISATTGVASLAAYLIQVRGVKTDTRTLLALYTAELDEREGTIFEGKAWSDVPLEQRGLVQHAQAEIAWRRANDPPLMLPDPPDPVRMTLHQRLTEQHKEQWQRRPGDPDFLRVRVGIGAVAPRFSVRLPEQATSISLPVKDGAFRRAHERAQLLVKGYRRLPQGSSEKPPIRPVDVPIAIPLREHTAVAIVGAGTPSGADAARALIAQVALHHSPREAQVIVVAPRQNQSIWAWVGEIYAPSNPLPSVIMGNQDEREGLLARVHGELLRREQAAREHHGQERAAPLPHLILVIDAPQGGDASLLASPAVELALRAGRDLGVTVVSIHARLADAPVQATLALDLAAREVRLLVPEPPAPARLSALDSLAQHETASIRALATRFAPEDDAAQRMPDEVKLLDLLPREVALPDRYDIQHAWEEGRALALAEKQRPKGSFSIPIGRTAARQALLLDFVNDGPHGLLIGQTGSGKSELLRSLVAALAITYPPDVVRFILVDYKGGIELEAFEQLPHTLALLTNMAQQGQTNRFLAMLKAELDDRQEKRKADIAFPRLFVVIDEFAEMVANRGGPNDASDVILERLLGILRLGRALDVHLLFASQRPEGGAMQKLAGYVQYRICLRANTEEDSKAVLNNRPDAARIPVDIPGRGYLLRGDYDLQLFQAARVAYAGAPVPNATTRAPTVDEIVAGRMGKLPLARAIERWPKALPTPEASNAAPLILIIHGPGRPVVDAWGMNLNKPALRPMEAPLGLYDRPSERLNSEKRGWFKADLFGHGGRLRGGPLLVTGDLNTGKTTTLQTLLLYFAMYYPAERLRWYVLDPTAAFGSFAGLAHSRDFHETHQVNIIDGLDEDQFKALRERFERALKVDPDPALGNAHPTKFTGHTRRPPLLLVIDDYDDLAARYRDKKALTDLVDLVMRSRDRDVYLALAMSRLTYNDTDQRIVNGAANRIVLYMNSSDNLGIALGARPPFATPPVPGRGFVRTRSHLDEIQIAAPVYGADDAERLSELDAVLRRGP